MERRSTLVFPGYSLLDLDRHIFITRLVQGVPSNRGSADPNYANCSSLEEDVREGCRTKLRRETIVDNGRATGYLLRGTSHPHPQPPTYLHLSRSGLLASADEEFVGQVVSHLHPKDLLGLSRSSRHLHSLLMTSGASPYWRVARRSIELPEAHTRSMRLSTLR